MSAKVSKAINRLMYLVAAGVEFPEAEYRVRDQFKLTQGQWNEVLESYDACFE